MAIPLFEDQHTLDPLALPRPEGSHPWIGMNAEVVKHVITADIPLAADVIKKGGLALNPRGVLYTRENIGECLAMRDHADEIRSSGIDTGGPSAFSKSDRRAFANHLDRLLARRSRE